jgi:predicted DNA-binding ribbon-helix-helix protein
MRTTLTLDDDVAVKLERLRESRRTSLKALVNEALRLGLRGMEQPPAPKTKPFRTRSVSLGRCFFDNIDNVAEVIAIAEGDDYK